MCLCKALCCTLEAISTCFIVQRWYTFDLVAYYIFTRNRTVLSTDAVKVFFNIFFSLSVYLPLLCGPEGQIHFLQLFADSVRGNITFLPGGNVLLHVTTELSQLLWATRLPGLPQSLRAISKLSLLSRPRLMSDVKFLAIALSGVPGIAKFAMCFISWFAWVETSLHTILSWISQWDI